MGQRPSIQNLVPGQKILRGLGERETMKKRMGRKLKLRHFGDIFDIGFLIRRKRA